MTNRNKLILISTLIVIGLIIAWEPGSILTGTSSVVAQSATGCSMCHPKLSVEVPEGHFKPALNEVKNCLACHSLEGTATAFVWTTHQTHYVKLGAAANCMFCHKIDAGGHFRLIGVEGGKDIPVTSSVVEKMAPYYQSWATSDRLDHRHALHGVTCASCHGVAFPDKEALKENCFKCHGSYLLVAQQAPFPHDDAIDSHFGPLETECSACHKPHSKSVLYCNLCHSFNDEVP
jgi:hypothetical protein